MGTLNYFSVTYLERKAAVSLIKELGFWRLIKPFFVLIQRNEPNSYELQIKGYFSNEEIEEFLGNRGLEFEQHEDFLIISKP